MKMLPHALTWAERGFAVLPLTPRDKSPLGHLAPNGAYSATRDLAVIRRWWKAEPEANIGVAADHGLILLDIDPRHGGHLSLAELEIENGDLPATLWEWSGGVYHCEALAADVRGKHIWLQMPDSFDGEPACGELRGYPGVDARCHGKYVAVAPSIHPSGTRYELGVPLSTEVAIIPDWLLDVMPGAGRSVDQIDVPAIEGVFFDLDQWSAARMLQWTWEKHRPNRRETLAYYCYRLFHSCCSPEQAVVYLRQAAMVLETLSPHRESFDAEAWVQSKLRQVYRRGRTPKPSPWRMGQILGTEQGVNRG